MLSRRNLAAAVAIVAVCGTSTVRAATTKFPDFPPPSADQLRKAGDQYLGVGVYVMDDIAQQKTYFETELSHSGVIPIWVSISNLSSDQTFLFDVDELSLTGPRPDGAGISDANSSVDDRAGTALVITDLFVGTLVLGLIGQSMLADASNVKKNLVDRGLYSRTVAPGQSTSGFVYVRRDKTHLNIDGLVLNITAHLAPVSVGSTALHYGVAL
jgi:hypothetical protein